MRKVSIVSWQVIPYSSCTVSEKVISGVYLGASKLFKVIEVDTPKKLVTNACYGKQHVSAYLQLFLR